MKSTVFIIFNRRTIIIDFNLITQRIKIFKLQMRPFIAEDNFPLSNRKVHLDI